MRVMNQFIVQRVLGARDIWHASHGHGDGGLCQAVPALIIVLPGLILFARHPEFMLGDWAGANPPRRWRLCRAGAGVLSRRLARLAAGGADLRGAATGQFRWSMPPAQS
jgi:hypothetical protein